MPNPLDLTNVNVSASFQNLLQIDANGNPYNLVGNQINSMTLRSTIYPLISFSAIDYTVIPANAFLIGFDSDAGNKLTKLDNTGTITIIEGAGGGGGGIITSISDTNTVDLAIISGDLSAVVKYQNSSDILLSSDGSGLIASFASTDISQFTNDANYITLGDLSGGTGISYNNLTGQITNSAPDQTVALTNGTGISISGTYPNFTITNSLPDQTVALTQGGTTTITGTYPNFTISSADQFTGTVTSVQLASGTGISLSGTNPITSSGTITVTNTAPDQVVALTNGTGISITGIYPNFTITNSLPDQTVAISSGTGISVSGTYPNFTVANSDTGSAQNIFKNIAVAGQNTVVADSNNDTLTLASGSGITITTNDSTDTITIAASGTSGPNASVTLFNYYNFI